MSRVGSDKAVARTVSWLGAVFSVMRSEPTVDEHLVWRCRLPRRRGGVLLQPG